MLRRALRLSATVMLSAVVAAGVTWGALAIWFDGPQSRVLAGMLAAVVAVKVKGSIWPGTPFG